MDLKKFLYSQSIDQPAVAVGAMLTGLLTLSLQDSIGKILSEHLTLWQFQTVRAAFNILFVYLLARLTMGNFSLRPLRMKPVLARAFFHVCALTFFFGGAPFLSLAEMAGGLYTFPLFVAVLSVVVLGERVGLLRVLAIGFGFIGTMMIIRPGSDSFTVFSLMPVAAGFCYAWVVIITRRYCRGESPVVLTMVSNISILFVGGAVLALIVAIDPSETLRSDYPNIMNAWRPMTAWALALIVVCTVFNVIGNIALSKAYQSAESSFLAPFDYSYLVFAAFWGLVIWGDVPGPMTIAGMVMIAGAGIFVAWREKVRAQLSSAASG